MKDVRNKILAANIKAERNRKNLSQFELAEKINVSESTISLIERGLQTPSVFLVLDIAKTLEIDINELFRGL
ncbi:helix-turn-helix transcriptional regulator [bacterium]|nr:helix-turn-helix transcriptional regulator [bacterium]